MRSIMNIAALIIGGLAAIWAGLELCVVSPHYGPSLFVVALLVGFTVAVFGLGAFFLGVCRIVARIRDHIPEIS